MTVKACDCICGERVVVIVGRERQGVSAHNQTSYHQAWRSAGGMEREVYGPTPHELFMESVVRQWHAEHGPEVPER